MRDLQIMKDLLEYLDKTKNEQYNINWLSRGELLIKDLNTYNNLESNESILNYIKSNINKDYIS